MTNTPKNKKLNAPNFKPLIKTNKEKKLKEQRLKKLIKEDKILYSELSKKSVAEKETLNKVKKLIDER